MRVLLVEDEPDVAGFIKKALDEEEHEVTVAMDGSAAFTLIQSNTYDLFVFDVMLPGINGLELCKRCRQLGITTPTLMLTALGTTDNIVLGLDSGADDYLTKPFNLAVLHARIRALIRRPIVAPQPSQPPTSVHQLRFANLQINLHEKTVLRDQAEVVLTATEFRLLEYLMRNPRKVLSRMEILEHVWGYDFNLNTKVVDVYINYLRKKLDRDSPTKLIQTVVGMGYILKEVNHED